MTTHTTDRRFVTDGGLAPLQARGEFPGNRVTDIEHMSDEILDLLTDYPGIEEEALYWQVLNVNEVFEEALERLQAEGRVHEHLGRFYSGE